MKKLLIMMTVLLSSAVAIAQLSGDEKKKVSEHLQSSLDALEKSVSGLSEAQLNFKADTSKWSIKECVYHLALSETNIWGWMQGVMSAPAAPDKRALVKATDDQVMAGVEDRSHKIKTSEPFEPKNAKWANSADALKFLKSERAAHISFLNASADDYRNHVAEQGPMGPMDAYQIVLLLAQHTVRHTKQIEEVKASPGYPSK